ncbi:MAG: S9 family peptidase, partial [Flavobacteriales bacterium]
MAIQIQSAILATFIFSSALNAQRMNYPETPKKPNQLEFFGERIIDNYQWLENDTSSETERWVDEQIAFTRNHLDQIPERNRIATRFQELFNFEKVGAPMRAGEYFFIYKNAGLEPQGKYYIRKGLQGEDKVFLDINTLDPNGLASASLIGADDQNRWMAVSINEAGSDWSSIVVYDIASGKPMQDRLEWVKFSGAKWMGDGFYYSRYPRPEPGQELSGNNLYHSVYFHRIGTPQDQDQLIHKDEARPYMYNNVGLSEDKRYLFLTAAPGTDTYEVWYQDLKKADNKFIPLFTDMSAHTSPVDADGEGFILALTDVGAPRYRLVRVDLGHPEAAQWQTVIPESDMLLQGVSTCGKKLYLSYLDKANTRIFECDRDGTHRKEISLPDQTGTASGFYGKAEDDYCFYSFTSFTYPGVIFKYDLKSGRSDVFYQSKVKFNPSDYVSKQVMYTSKDGTQVPMFIVHKKGLERNG